MWFSVIGCVVKKMKKKDLPKAFLVLSLNTFTLGMFVFATVFKPNFTDWLLAVSIVNIVIYFLYYLYQKNKTKEKIRPLIWIWLFLDIIILGLSLVFFFKSVSDKFLSHEESNKLNILNKTIEAKAKIHPSIELKETYLEKSIVTTNTINAANEDGKNIITSGPIPVATPFPPLNLL